MRRVVKAYTGDGVIEALFVTLGKFPCDRCNRAIRWKQDKGETMECAPGQWAYCWYKTPINYLTGKDVKEVG